MQPVENLPEATNKGSHVTRKESTCFCHASMVWLALETTENMAELNVDMFWGSFKSNLTFIFDLNYFLWK